MNARCGTRCTPAHLKNGAYASVLCAVMLALVVALNLLWRAACAKYLRYDMTENKLYSLSQETEGPVRGL